MSIVSVEEKKEEKEKRRRRRGRRAERPRGTRVTHEEKEGGGRSFQKLRRKNTPAYSCHGRTGVDLCPDSDLESVQKVDRIRGPAACQGIFR